MYFIRNKSSFSSSHSLSLSIHPSLALLFSFYLSRSLSILSENTWFSFICWMVLTFSFWRYCFSDQLHVDTHTHTVCSNNSLAVSHSLFYFALWSAIFAIDKYVLWHSLYDEFICWHHRRTPFHLRIESRAHSRTNSEWNSIEWLFFSSDNTQKHAPFHHASIKVYCLGLCEVIDWAQI